MSFPVAFASGDAAHSSSDGIEVIETWGDRLRSSTIYRYEKKILVTCKCGSPVVPAMATFEEKGERHQQKHPQLLDARLSRFIVIRSNREKASVPQKMAHRASLPWTPSDACSASSQQLQAVVQTVPRLHSYHEYNRRLTRYLVTK